MTYLYSYCIIIWLQLIDIIPSVIKNAKINRNMDYVFNDMTL